MASQTFPKTRRLRKRSEFLRVQEASSRVTLPSCIVLLLARADDQPARFGVTVTRKFGGAVQRNRAKRLFREVFRRSPELFPAGIDFVVIPKTSAAQLLSLVELRSEWQKAGRLIATRAESLRRALANNRGPTQTGGPRGVRR